MMDDDGDDVFKVSNTTAVQEVEMASGNDAKVEGQVYTQLNLKMATRL